MGEKVKAIHYLNQFFGGLGGEEQAGSPPQLFPGARGPGLLLAKLCPELDIVATLVAGDNYLAEHPERGGAELLALLTPLFEHGMARPRVLLAGPAFNAGRYGLACGLVCSTVQEAYQIPTLTAMAPENPAVDQYRRTIQLVKCGPDVMGMQEALNAMARLVPKLLAGQPILPEEDNTIPQGRRLNYFSSETGAHRALEMLLAKVRSEPFTSEYPMPSFDRVPPAPPITDLSQTTLALVTSGGIVPRGNPDRIVSANAQNFGCYSIKALDRLSPASHQTVHGGYDPTYANQDPNRVLPLDAVRELERAGVIGRLHDHYYATVGNATSVANARAFGLQISKKLLTAGVQAVILTST